ncbi:hypothetical protein Unana1_04731 [Umbelopsis nana]
MRTSLILSTAALLTLALGTNADIIIINSPAQDAQLQQATNVEIRYTVRYQDMALLGSASTSLMYPNGTEAVANISTAKQSDWNESRMVAFNWTVPEVISDGSYVLRVAGPAGYKCSKNNNGKAPWTRCYLTIASEVNVTIGEAPVQIKNNLAPASINNTQSRAVVKAMSPSLSPPTLTHNAAPMSFVEAVTNAASNMDYAEISVVLK